MPSQPWSPPPHVAAALAALAARDELGVFHARDAARFGVDAGMLRKLANRGRIWRAERGWYAAPPRGLTPEQVHSRRVAAVVGAHGGRAVASHQSAVAWHGLPVVFDDLATVHATYVGKGSFRARKGLICHIADPSAAAFVAGGEDVPGRRMAVPAEYAIVQVGLRGRPLSALVAGDAALALGRVTGEAIGAAVEAYAGAPGIVAVREVLTHLDAKAESALESLGRYCAHMLGFRGLRPQVRIAVGKRRYRADLADPDAGLVVEFDGLRKYRHEDPQDAAAAVAAHAARQADLERAGWHVVRFTWEQVVDPVADTLRVAAVKARLDTAYVMARARRG